KEEVWERWTESEDAWDYYIRGRKEAFRYGGYGERALRTGLALLNKALELDSNFALPYANMASINGRLYHFGFELSDSIKSLSKRLAERAGELSEHVWVSNWPLARYYYFCEKNHDSALYYYEKAYRGDKNHVDYLACAHHCLRRMGRWQEAYDYMARIVELEPKAEWYKLDLAANCFYMHRYEEAETLLKDAIDLSPSYWEANSVLFRLYLMWQGDFEKARAVVRQSEGFIDSTRWTILLDWITNLEEGYAQATDVITMPPRDSLNYHYGLGMTYFRMGKIDSSRIHFRHMRNQYDRDVERLRTDADLNRSYARMFAGLGERELAIEHMNKALELIPPDKDALTHSDLFTFYPDIFALLGDTKTQVAYFDSLLSMPNRHTGLGLLLVDPDYKKAVLHPDFKAIMTKHADAIQWRLYETRFGSL
ncbi:MAG: hypothetical protein KAT79_04845, partial [candidate division Zixibacteria bacterium]|nr:hypothetical protein [candidate division Zixibacteria bacterium]